MATATTEPARRTRRQWLRRCAWMLGIWAASVACLALFSWLFRWLMSAAGWTGAG